MIGGSWTHRMVRPFVRPMIGTRIRPNHLTTLRVLSGFVSCVFIAIGTPMAMGWGGALWLVSALLDRADGELARLGKLMSSGGHMYDYYSDLVINALFFAAAGIGLRHGWFGEWSILLGGISAASLIMCAVFSEWLEQLSPPGTRAYTGRWGFDPDDALYLMAPLAWLGWLSPVLVGASIGATAIMLLTGWRFRQLSLQQA